MPTKKELLLRLEEAEADRDAAVEQLRKIQSHLDGEARNVHYLNLADAMFKPVPETPSPSERPARDRRAAPSNTAPMCRVPRDLVEGDLLHLSNGYVAVVMNSDSTDTPYWPDGDIIADYRSGGGRKLFHPDGGPFRMRDGEENPYVVRIERVVSHVEEVR